LHNNPFSWGCIFPTYRQADGHDEASGCFYSFVNVPTNYFFPTLCVCVWLIWTVITSINSFN
jgi:hypothetical protein